MYESLFQILIGSHYFFKVSMHIVSVKIEVLNNLELSIEKQ